MRVLLQVFSILFRFHSACGCLNLYLLPIKGDDFNNTDSGLSKSESIVIEETNIAFVDKSEQHQHQSELEEVEGFSVAEIVAMEELFESQYNDKPPEAKKGKYKHNSPKRSKPLAHGVVYIQSGQKYRAPIEKSDFEAFMNEANLKIGKSIF